MAGITITPDQQRAYFTRLAADRRAHRAALIGSQGPAGPCRRVTESGETLEILGRPNPTPAQPTHHGAALAVDGLMAAAPVLGAPSLTFVLCRCPHCARLLAEPPFDPVELLQAMAGSIGPRLFTTAELMRHADVVGGRLLAAMAGKDSRKIGRALETLAGKTIDGTRLERIGLDRSRVALWKLFCRE